MQTSCSHRYRRAQRHAARHSSRLRTKSLRRQTPRAKLVHGSTADTLRRSSSFFLPAGGLAATHLASTACACSRGSMHPGDRSAVALFFSPWTVVCRVRALSAAQASRQSQGEQQITAHPHTTPPHKSQPPIKLQQPLNFKSHCETLRDSKTLRTPLRTPLTLQDAVGKAAPHAELGTTTANRDSDSHLLTKTLCVYYMHVYICHYAYPLYMYNTHTSKRAIIFHVICKQQIHETAAI